MQTYYVHELIGYSGHRVVGKLHADDADPISLLDLAKKKYPKIKNILVSIYSKLKRFRSRISYGSVYGPSGLASENFY